MLRAKRRLSEAGIRGVKVMGFLKRAKFFLGTKNEACDELEIER